MLIPDRESDKVEFKTALNNAVIETLVAFSNAKGGTVYVGVADNSKVTGVSLAKETFPQFINEIKNKTSPSIIPDAEIIDAGGRGNKKVVIFSVTEYPIKPVSFLGKYYKRVNASNHLLSANEVANMHLQTVNSSWDFHPRPNKMIDDISLEKVRKAMNVIKKRNENFQFETETEFLEKNELLLRDNHITNGCFLMFSKNENLWTTIQMGHFASEIVIKDDVVNSEDILTQIEDVMDFIRKHISKALIITDRQVENIPQWQYPLDGLRELALNMIIHRDYTASNDSIIKIFPDHILFFNPGTLPDTITIEQLQTNQYVSTPRNRQIAKLAKDMGLIERYGTGIKRVRKMFVDYGLKEPTFELISGGLAVTVYGLENLSEAEEEGTDRVTNGGTNRNLEKDLEKDLEKTSIKDAQQVMVKVRDKISDNQLTILNSIEQNPRITISELSAIVKISERNVRVNISKLKAMGLILRIGADRGGYWRVIK